jgi:hypothetical protein
MHKLLPFPFRWPFFWSPSKGLGMVRCVVVVGYAEEEREANALIMKQKEK